MVEEVMAAGEATRLVFRVTVSFMEIAPAWESAAACAAEAVPEQQRWRADGQRREAEHLDRLQELIRVEAAREAKPRRRGPAGQQAKRRLEQEIRGDAVACYRRLQVRGDSLAEAAQLLGLEPRTLRQWDYDCRPESITVVPLGRPTQWSTTERRNAVFDFLNREGAGVGVPTLQQAFPDLARAELTDLVQRYRRVLYVRRRDNMRRLCWRVPGRVWAMDFAEPSELGATWSLPPIDDEFPYLLAVRDLASGYQLAWLPMRQATSQATRAVLRMLFEQHGAPLVLKADNGPPFRADETKSLLQEADVRFLFSPPYWPAYNGAIEAAIASLKRRTEQQAAQQGRAGRWAWVHVEAARAQANAAQPRRLHGLTPAEVWAGRTRVTDLERVRFGLAVERESYLACNQMNLAQERHLDHWQSSAVERKAIERALVEHDYLLFRRRRLPLSVKIEEVTSFV